MEAQGKAEPFRTECGKAAIPLFLLAYFGFLLGGGTQEPAKDTLNADLVSGQGQR